MAEEFKRPKGLRKKIFGSILFFLGGLNTMFAVKAGFKVETFFVVLLVAGALIFAYGLVEGFKAAPPGGLRENRKMGDDQDKT